MAHEQAIPLTDRPAYAWPGGYPVYYLTADSSVLCPPCANGKNGSLAAEQGLEIVCDKQWIVVASDIHWEGEPLTCDHCGAEIESAYGTTEKEQHEDA